MPDTGILCQLIKKAGGTVTRNILTKEKLSYLVCGDLDDMKEWMISKKNHFAKSPEYAMLDTYVHLKHPQIVTSKVRGFHVCNFFLCPYRSLLFL